jgi:hypothetical protein
MWNVTAAASRLFRLLLLLLSYNGSQLGQPTSKKEEEEKE